MKKNLLIAGLFIGTLFIGTAISFTFAKSNETEINNKSPLLVLDENSVESCVKINIPKDRYIDFSSMSLIESIKSPEDSRRYFKTQCQELVSYRNLMQVVKSLALAKSDDSSTHQAVLELRKQIQIIPIEGTYMVRIIVSHPDKNLSCHICDAILRCYVDIKCEYQKMENAHLRHEFDNAEKELEQQLENNIQALTYAIKKYSKINVSQVNMFSVLSTYEQDINYLNRSILELNLEINQLDILMDSIVKMKEEDSLLNFVLESDAITCAKPSVDRIRSSYNKIQELKYIHENLKYEQAQITTKNAKSNSISTELFKLENQITILNNQIESLLYNLPDSINNYIVTLKNQLKELTDARDKKTLELKEETLTCIQANEILNDYKDNLELRTKMRRLRNHIRMYDRLESKPAIEILEAPVYYEEKETKIEK